MKKANTLKMLAIVWMGLLLYACASPSPPLIDLQLGLFTVASTQNVSQLRYKSLDTIRYRVKGQSCIEVDPHTLAYIKGPRDDRVQRAMDAAIESGHDQGMKGDLLINVRIREKTVFLPPRKDGDASPHRMECITVDGELAELAQ